MALFLSWHIWPAISFLIWIKFPCYIIIWICLYIFSMNKTRICIYLAPSPDTTTDKQCLFMFQLSWILIIPTEEVCSHLCSFCSLVPTGQLFRKGNPLFCSGHSWMVYSEVSIAWNQLSYSVSPSVLTTSGGTMMRAWRWFIAWDTGFCLHTHKGHACKIYRASLHQCTELTGINE